MWNTQKLQAELQAKYPAYHAALRQGRNLKGRCTKIDPERNSLQNLLDEMAEQWSSLLSLANQKYGNLFIIVATLVFSLNFDNCIFAK